VELSLIVCHGGIKCHAEGVHPNVTTVARIGLYRADGQRLLRKRFHGNVSGEIAASSGELRTPFARILVPTPPLDLGDLREPAHFAL